MHGRGGNRRQRAGSTEQWGWFHQNYEAAHVLWAAPGTVAALRAAIQATGTLALLRSQAGWLPLPADLAAALADGTLERYAQQTEGWPVAKLF